MLFRSRAATRVAAAVQPRGAASPILIPEYRKRIWLRLPHSCIKFPADIPDKLIGSEASEVLVGAHVPKGSKILSLRAVMGASGSESEEYDIEIGIAWSTEDFVSRALRLQHPFDSVAVDDNILRSAFFSLTAPPAATRRHREATLAFWRERALHLEEREAELRGQVHPDV